MLKTFCAAAMVLLSSAGLFADDTAGSNAMKMKSYVYVKQDDSLFVGEGVANLKEFEGDYYKAVVAAKERARLDLGSGIRVQVSGLTSEKSEYAQGKSSEEIQSQSKSQVQVNLENVKYMEFKDLPEQGQVTVLASLSKEDYRRQLAGKAVKVYLPENGLRLAADLTVNRTDAKIADGVAQAGKIGAGGQTFGLNLDYTLHSWVAGLALPNFLANTPTLFLVNAGYDWTPWPWRLQPFVPLRLDYGLWQQIGGQEGNATANTVGISAGLGARVWINDFLAFQFSAIRHQGLLNATLSNNAGPSEAVTLDGWEYQIGLLLSSF